MSRRSSVVAAVALLFTSCTERESLQMIDGRLDAAIDRLQYTADHLPQLQQEFDQMAVDLAQLDAELADAGTGERRPLPAIPQMVPRSAAPPARTGLDFRTTGQVQQALADKQRAMTVLEDKVGPVRDFNKRVKELTDRAARVRPSNQARVNAP